MHILSVLLCASISYALTLPSQNGSKSDVSKNINPRIINGETASPGQFPWQARLQVNSPRISFTCGGTIIDKQWILTAAHCLASIEVVSIYIGDDGEFVAPGAFIIHENYKPSGLINDIALLQFMDINQNPNPQWKPIPLASDRLEAGTEVTVIGWGETGDGSSGLHYATLSTIENTICDQIYGEGTILDEMVCALSVTTMETPCFGDAGGSLVVNATDNAVLEGIVSFFGDSGCYDGYPSAYTRVASYRDWITSKIGI